MPGIAAMHAPSVRLHCRQIVMQQGVEASPISIVRWQNQIAPCLSYDCHTSKLFEWRTLRENSIQRQAGGNNK
jgi:hypothetical protein